MRGSVSKQMVINALKHAGVEIEAIRRLVRQALKPFITRKKKPRQHWEGVLAGQFGGLKVLRGIDLHAVSSFPESETDSCDGHHIFTFFHRLWVAMIAPSRSEAIRPGWSGRR